jgi:hypothetical protein
MKTERVYLNARISKLHDRKLKDICKYLQSENPLYKVQKQKVVEYLIDFMSEAIEEHLQVVKNEVASSCEQQQTIAHKEKPVLRPSKRNQTFFQRLKK